MRADDDFPVDQFIAKMSALRCFDRVMARVRITVHEVGMQDTDVRSMHLRDQAMWFKSEFCVNPMGTSGVQDPIKERGRRRWCAKCVALMPRSTMAAHVSDRVHMASARPIGGKYVG